MYNITKRKDGKWEVKKTGAKRASKIFDTQLEAIKYCEDNKYEYKVNSDDAIGKTVNAVKKHGLRTTIILILLFAVIGVTVWFLYSKGYLGTNKPSSNEHPTTIEGENFSIHFLELGNENSGDCTYIKAGDNDILIDAGSKKSSAITIKRYLDQFVTDGKLEYVIATHAHLDHIAGFVDMFDGILYNYEVGTIIDFALTKSQTNTYNAYLTARDECVKKGTKHYTAAECWNNENGASRTFNLGEGLSLDIIYNKYYFEYDPEPGENNYSVCTMFNSGDTHFFLTGDLEVEGETSIAEYYDGSTPEKTLPQVDVYKAGHHGSKTSSHDVLLSKIQPKICCVCCCAGYTEYTNKNTSIFPTQEFVDRISKYTDSVYVTTKFNEETKKHESFNGNIRISSNGKELAVNCSNNNTKLKDSDWFNQEIYVKKDKDGFDIVSSDKRKTDFFSSATPGARKIIRRIWPK